MAGDGRVGATWQPPSSGELEAGYYVLRLGGAADPVAYVLATGNGVQSATISGLPNGVPVTLNVTAVNPSGVSAPSANSNVVTPGRSDAANHVPAAVADRATAVAGGKAVVVNVLANDNDPDGDALAILRAGQDHDGRKLALVHAADAGHPEDRDRQRDLHRQRSAWRKRHGDLTVTITVSPSPLVVGITRVSLGQRPVSLDLVGRIAARAGASLRCSESFAVTLGNTDVTAARGRSRAGTCQWRSGSLHSANLLVGRWSARTHRFEVHLSGVALRRLPPRAETVDLAVRIGDDAGRTVIHLTRAAPDVRLALRSRAFDANGTLHLEIGCPARVRSIVHGCAHAERRRR